MTDARKMREAAARASYENGSMLAESIDWSDLEPSNLTHEFAIKRHHAIADAVARVVLEAAIEQCQRVMHEARAELEQVDPTKIGSNADLAGRYALMSAWDYIAALKPPEPAA